MAAVLFNYLHLLRQVLLPAMLLQQVPPCLRFLVLKAAGQVPLGSLKGLKNSGQNDLHLPAV